MSGLEKKLRISLIFLSCSVGDLFVDINYTIFYDKEELMEDLLRSREKFYHCKYIVYAIILTKIVQLYCTSDLRKYKRGNMRNGTGRLSSKWHQVEE